MKKFENELSKLRERVVEMGNLAETMVSQAVDAIPAPRDQNLLNAVLIDEERLDQMQLDVDREAIRLLTVYSPVAADLRFVMSVSRITAELERMGDHAVNMCEFIQLLPKRTDIPLLPELQKMAQVVKTMVAGALNAFLHNDGREAQTTIAHDDMVDALNDQIVEELVSDELLRQVVEGETNIAVALAQVLIARSLERIADQATNIGEEVVYMVQGDDIRHQDSLGVSDDSA